MAEDWAEEGQASGRVKPMLKAETPYYFFLSDEKGKYYYAKNYTEHQNNAAKAARVGDGEVHGIGVGQNG